MSMHLGSRLVASSVISALVETVILLSAFGLCILRIKSVV